MFLQEASTPVQNYDMIYDHKTHTYYKMIFEGKNPWKITKPFWNNHISCVEDELCDADDDQLNSTMKL